MTNDIARSGQHSIYAKTVTGAPVQYMTIDPGIYPDNRDFEQVSNGKPDDWVCDYGRKPVGSLRRKAECSAG